MTSLVKTLFACTITQCVNRTSIRNIEQTLPVVLQTPVSQNHDLSCRYICLSAYNSAWECAIENSIRPLRAGMNTLHLHAHNSIIFILSIWYVFLSTVS